MPAAVRRTLLQAQVIDGATIGQARRCPTSRLTLTKQMVRSPVSQIASIVPLPVELVPHLSAPGHGPGDFPPALPRALAPEDSAALSAQPASHDKVQVVMGPAGRERPLLSTPSHCSGGSAPGPPPSGRCGPQLLCLFSGVLLTKKRNRSFSFLCQVLTRFSSLLTKNHRSKSCIRLPV